MEKEEEEKNIWISFTCTPEQFALIAKHYKIEGYEYLFEVNDCDLHKFVFADVDL